MKKSSTFLFLNKIKTYKLFKKIALGNFNTKNIYRIIKSFNLETTKIKSLIIGATQAFLKYSKKLPKPKFLFCDVVGTGGDKSNTINISTTSAFIASFCDLKIAKHCNNNVTSLSGSANLINSFNINLNSSPNYSLQLLNKFNLCFLYSPNYNSGFQHVSSIRKKIKTKTIFNIIGPLLNPFRPPLIVIGVYNKELIPHMIYAVKFFNYKRALVLHSSGTDEVTLHGHTHVAELKDKKITFYKLQPEDFGIKKHTTNFSIGGSIKKNKSIITQLIKGKSYLALEQILAANVAMIFKVFGFTDLKKTTRIALKAIQSGKIYNHVLKISKAHKKKKNKNEYIKKNNF